MSLSCRTSRRVALGSLFALTMAMTSPTIFADDKADAAKGKKEVKLGLDGYCPVCIVDGKKWVRGKSKFQTTYDGVTYRFPGDGPKQKFLADPARYVPALGGDCVVCYAKAGKRVPGSIRHTASHAGRLYMFPSDREKQAFLAAPEKFAKTDLAHNGNCVVCLKYANKQVPGKPEFTAIHKGLRYQFPSDRERQMFVKNPERYAATEKSPKASADSGANSADRAIITVTGKTTCAGCEHGVTPIGAPNELGLAVNTADGRVIVVENAHTKWPSVYKARYAGQNVKVTGRVIKTKGKIKWIAPTELKVL